jgi:hypothetical protein
MNSGHKFIPVFGKICWKKDTYNESPKIKRDGFYSWGWIVGDEVWILGADMLIDLVIYNYVEYNKWNRKVLSPKRIKKFGIIRGKVRYMIVGNNVVKNKKPVNLPILPELSIEELKDIEYKQKLNEKEVFFHVF